MALDYLEQLEQLIERGESLFACPGIGRNEWHIGDDLSSLRQKAQRTANSQRFEAGIFRLINLVDASGQDPFLIVRSFIETGGRGEPNLRRSLVDTREAAEMLRDVSNGPTPYFGAVLEEIIKPEKSDKMRLK